LIVLIHVAACTQYSLDWTAG